MPTLSWMVVALLSAGAAGEAQSVAVMPLVAKRVPKETVAVLDDLVLASIGQTGKYRALGPGDINAMLGMEKMKQLLGCDDVSCAVEIGGALGVPALVTGSVSKLGTSVIVTLSLVDTKARVVERRSKAQVKDDENLYAQAIDSAVCQLLQPEVDCAAKVPATGRAPAPLAGDAVGRGYQQYRSGRLVKNEPTMPWADAVVDCIEAVKKNDKKVAVACDFDGKRMGYELFFDGALAGYEPGWSLEQGSSNCAWNIGAHEAIRVDCRFEGKDIRPVGRP